MWAAAGGFVGAATEVVISMDTSLLVHGAVHLPHPRPLLAMLVAETPRAGSLCGFPPAAATGIHHQATYSSCRLFSQGPYGAVVCLKALTVAICLSVYIALIRGAGERTLRAGTIKPTRCSIWASAASAGRE
jgi:hypothetical protein